MAEEVLDVLIRVGLKSIYGWCFVMSKMDSNWHMSICQPCSTNLLFKPMDVDKYDDKSDEFKKLSSEDKGKYKSPELYMEEKYGLKIENLNKDYMRLYREVKKQLEETRKIELLAIDFIMQEKTVLDMLSSFEDTTYIKDIYKYKKTQVSGGINDACASMLVDCMRQGRRLLEAAQSANVLAKPLIDFYAATAYAYALIVINSPLHKGLESLKGSHGHKYNHEDNIVEFGGEIPRGTFIDLLCATPVQYIYCRNDDADKDDIISYPLIDSINLIQQNNIQISLLTLLSMVPELQTYYTNVDKHKIIHSLRIDDTIKNKEVVYRFYIGDGEEKPDKENLKNAFRECSIEEKSGTYQILVPISYMPKIMPCIYQDIKGKLYYIDVPLKGVVIPEVCLHFLIISSLCNIMRYSPYEWNKLLTNKISSSFSLLINRYLRLFENKFPMIVVQYLSNYFPVLIQK